MVDEPDTELMGSRKDKMFSASGLLANSAITGVGTGLAVAALTTSLGPIALAGVGGAVVAYVLTNDIPKR